MKRIFCDLCQTEFKYSDKPVRDTNQAAHTFLKPRTGNEPAIEISVTLNIKAETLVREEIARRPGYHYQDIEPMVKRHHADLCGKCRDNILRRIDGTQSEDMEIQSLKWDTTEPDREPKTPDMRNL